MHKSPLNNIFLGCVLGLILPAIAGFLVFEIRFDDYSFRAFISMLNVQGVLTQVLSLCVVPNLLAFFLFIWTNRLLSARGVLLATFIATTSILTTKIIL
ncbi:MAG: hypothetical protein GVY19_13625 [Bacteroidetes bacterium]|jgi:hypothetical protein|nr:hypothetical protein [Bacteroidota bacterium]